MNRAEKLKPLQRLSRISKLLTPSLLLVGISCCSLNQSVAQTTVRPTVTARVINGQVVLQQSGSGLSTAIVPGKAPGVGGIAPNVGWLPAGENPEVPEGSPVPTKSVPSFDESREKQVKTLRFNALKSIKFDRRPSMILRAWADLRVAKNRPSSSASQVSRPPSLPAGANAQNKVQWPAKFDRPPLPKSQKQLQEEDRKWMSQQREKIADEVANFDIWLKTGQWKKAGEYLRQFTVAQQQQIFQKMVSEYTRVEKKFQNISETLPPSVGGVQAPRSNAGRQYMEKHQFDVNDFEGLISLAPAPISATQLRQLSTIIRTEQSFIGTEQDLKSTIKKIVSQTPNADKIERSMGSGFVEKSTQVARPTKPKDKKEEKRPVIAHLTKRQAAVLLLSAGKFDLAELFLPTPKECQKNGDAEGLNILSSIYLMKERTAEEDSEDFVVKAWETIQIVLSNKNISRKQKNEALIRAISLAPRLDKEIREKWLNEKFGQMDQSSKELLAVIGENASRGLQTNTRDAQARGRMLKIMKTATEVMLQNQEKSDVQQQALLTLLAKIWVSEAEVTKTYDQSQSLGMKMQRDRYGNFYYGGYQPYRGGYSSIAAIPTKTILETLPEGKWFQFINPAVKPKVSVLCAGLLLKVNEEERAFPYIESLHKTDKKAAQKLAEEFLRVWTVNHDLNAARNNGRYNPYYFSYGFNQAAQSIPLTRSKQERNLKDLTKWVAKLRSLKGIEVDQELLANAFTTCHSGAEVYRFEEIEKVFGEMKSIKPDVLAALTEKMRVNLKGLWRKPAVQKQAKTKRKKRQIQKQVVKGYQLALEVLEKAVADHPTNWRLASCHASVLFDQNEYLGELNNRKTYSKTKTAAYQKFAHSAKLYGQWAVGQPREKWSIQPYERWFNAMLGSPDLGKVDHKKIAATKQTALIKSSLESLGGKVAEEHLKRFATSIVKNVTRANPAVKFSFLTEGFRITGDREEILEAKKLYEYYQDLVTELELETVLDGSSEISSKQPFGVLVRINHTPEIERESGGFGRFLQNQNSMMYGYNYGRNTEDYRDKFEEAARRALNEDFEVLSITFESDKVKSRELKGKSGWRYTPYAYIVLKARGTEVDRIPSVRIDMDFLDTTGYVVLPIRSHAITVNCSATASEPRPFEGVEVTQTLDQREGSKGKLTLQIKAKGNGLIPDLEKILKLNPSEFEVVSVDDSRSTVNGFDKEKDEPTVISERIWEIELKGKSDLSKKADTFEFAKAEGDLAKMTLMSYQDEDVKEVAEIVTLKGNYTEAQFPWMTVIGGCSVAGIGLLLGLALFLGGGKTEQVAKPTASVDEMDTFQILGLLEKRINDPNLSDDHRLELKENVRRLEEEHFSSAGGSNGSDTSGSPVALAKKWLS